MQEKEIIESVTGEGDSYSDDSLYNITSFGTDIFFSQLITMYDKGDLIKPELQRKYVWTKLEASRFIDSILLGLPVPSIFLAKDAGNKRLIVDGYQRIMTIFDYYKGIFSGDDKVFKLSNSKLINPRWKNKAFVELDEDCQRAIEYYSIHAIIFEQKSPKNDTGMYQIFERINTGGRTLKSQEIRNCVYHGSLNTYIMELNKNILWRKILGNENEDSRMADIELILRFIAFINFDSSDEKNSTQIILSKYLNEAMAKNKNISEENFRIMEENFLYIMNYLDKKIGKNLFRNAKHVDGKILWAKNVNPVIFDAVIRATHKARILLTKDSLQEIDLDKQYIELLGDSAFIEATSQRTTNVEHIIKREKRALSILFGIN